MDRLLVSVSGGETSAYMAFLLKQAFGNSKDLRFVFANTGQEYHKTLDFVRRIDEEWALGITWVEAAVNSDRGSGTRHRVVTPETASLDGRPFADVIAKYGLPGPGYGHCNRELKLAPITSFLRSEGWDAGTYHTAIGIRADEIDRMSASASRAKILYPLVKLGVTKRDVRAFFDGLGWSLGLPDYLGNCVWCWKKSMRKLRLVAQDNPGHFDFPARMESAYETRRLDGRIENPPRRFFRGRKRVSDILDMALDARPLPEDADVQGSCGETCEVWADDFQEGLDLL